MVITSKCGNIKPSRLSVQFQMHKIYNVLIKDKSYKYNVLIISINDYRKLYYTLLNMSMIIEHFILANFGVPYFCLRIFFVSLKDHFSLIIYLGFFLICHSPVNIAKVFFDNIFLNLLNF